MKGFLKSFIGVALACLLLLGISLLLYVAAASFSSILASKKPSVNTSGGKNAPTVVIDPGHGGIDGGAVGVSGSYEKDLNLVIAKETERILSSMGYTVILTRSDDTLPSDGGKGSRKEQELRARIRVPEEQENAIFVSIHMNRFPDPSVKGMTFYYSPNHPDSHTLAESMRRVMLEKLQGDNRRPMKEATSGIYVLYHTTVPAVLVECGFLSNPLEEAMLKEEDYQNKIAQTISEGIDAFLKKSEESK